MAWLFSPEFAEGRLSPDGHLNDSTRSPIALYRFGLVGVAATMLALAGAFGPSLLWVSKRIRRFVWAWEVPVPPLLAQGYFAPAALIASDRLVLGPWMRPTEIRELDLAIAFAVWLYAERTRSRFYGGTALTQRDRAITTAAATVATRERRGRLQSTGRRKSAAVPHPWGSA